ncbi:hypothetical protein [Pedobacter aquatilis]|uniref:hypothetical protein n=1 Tax=Pedobacter aquatilis TaxID=351343 RepID=UPI00292EDEC3|nr:hypothetical protein [Pedobacter aquatilis]
MIKNLFLIFFLFAGFSAYAQHDPSDQMDSLEWDLIGGITMKTVKPTEIYAVFKPDIKKYQNKPFTIEGYIVPIKDGMKQTRFMFSPLPINQCFYCGQKGVPIMLLVEMNEAIKFTFKPVLISGTLKLNAGNTLSNPPVAITGSKLITE